MFLSILLHMLAGEWGMVQVLKASATMQREQLASEIALLLKLHHPNIVQFLGASTQAEPLMIVSEMMDGGSLEAALQRQVRPPLRRVLEIALDCARGLNFLHLANPHCLIHRDFKPSNILLAGPRTVSNQVAPCLPMPNAVCLCGCGGGDLRTWLVSSPLAPLLFMWSDIMQGHAHV
jgi:serine/threonine protein kinase